MRLMGTQVHEYSTALAFRHGEKSDSFTSESIEDLCSILYGILYELQTKSDTEDALLRLSM
jgi:hypothetical protein